MSSRDQENRETTTESSPAISVEFSRLADQHGESSSKAESRGSGSRSRGSRKSWRQDEDVALSKSTSHRSSNDLSFGDVERGNRKSGGFLLDSGFGKSSVRNGLNTHGRPEPRYGSLRVNKRPHGTSQRSQESSMRASPLSHEHGVDGTNEPNGGPATARPASVDAAQLVQMALNLSESRRRNVSNTLHVPTTGGRRATSAPIGNRGTVKTRSPSQKHSSRLNEDVAREHLRDLDNSQLQDGPVNEDAEVANVLFAFTPATLARAERARRYFELASEYRRLLESLQPLRAGSSGHAGGRTYNPIQSLRNRRIRIREKRAFEVPPSSWQDVSRVQDWVTEVEGTSKGESRTYESSGSGLAPFVTDSDAIPQHTTQQQYGGGHRRTDTAGTVITRPENSWTIEPTELLADAYWTESGDNKNYVENCNGRAILPPRARRSTDTPRISVEMYRGDNEDLEQSRGVEGSDEKPSRRRKLILPLISSERRRTGGLLSRASSTSSVSSDEGQRSKHSNDNIGPLERHMQELIAKDEQGEPSSSEPNSPDRWDSKHSQRTGIDSSMSKNRQLKGRGSFDVSQFHHKRTMSAGGRVDSREEAASNDPSGKIFKAIVPINSKPMPAARDDSSEWQDTEQPVEVAHQDDSALQTSESQKKEHDQIAETDFAEPIGARLSPIQSGWSWQPKGVEDEIQPVEKRPAVKRHKTTSSIASLGRTDTASTHAASATTREPNSAVERMLRGGRDRIGGLVFGERFKKREKTEADQLIEPNENDETDKVDGWLDRSTADLTNHGDEPSPRTSFDRLRPKPKYHVTGLPSFTSSSKNRRSQLGTLGSTGSDPFIARRSAQQTPESKGLHRLNTDLPRARAWDPELVGKDVSNSELARKSYGQLHANFGSLPRNSLMPGMYTPGMVPAKRHWSIYDRRQLEQAEKIRSRDIARVRALLLTSGIKAREIQRRSEAPSDNPLALTKAAKTANQTLADPVALKDEPSTAAHLLSTHISSVLSAFETTLEHFQNDIATSLATQLDDLHHRATEHLTKLVLETSDEADAFVVELTTRQPQQLKQVDDAVETIRRARRRQWRLLRGLGFKLLEWLVLSLMWGIWGVVVVFNSGKRVAVVLWRMVAWLFSF